MWTWTARDVYAAGCSVLARRRSSRWCVVIPTYGSDRYLRCLSPSQPSTGRGGAGGAACPARQGVRHHAKIRAASELPGIIYTWGFVSARPYNAIAQPRPRFPKKPIKTKVGRYSNSFHGINRPLGFHASLHIYGPFQCYCSSRKPASLN